MNTTRQAAMPGAAMPELPKILVACAINLLAVSTVFMTQSIFLELSHSFQIDITQARFSFSIVSLCYSIAFFFLGPAADTFDLPKIAVTGVILLAATVLLASQARDFHMFIIAMGAMGVCAATIPAAMFPHVATISPDERLGMNVGLIVASGTLGVILGRVAMGIMTEALGWRLSFRIVAAILLALAAMAYRVLVRHGTTRPRNPDGLGTLYLRSIRLMLTPTILALLLVGFTLFTGFLGMVTFLTYRLLEPPFNFTSGQIGWISFAGLTALIAPFAGAISRRTGVVRIIFLGLALSLASFQLMGWFASVPLIALGLLLLFLSVYSCQPLVFLLMGRNVSRESIGSASSLYILFCIGGGSLSSIILGPVWKVWGWHGVTLSCSLALVLAMAIMLALTRRADLEK